MEPDTPTPVIDLMEEQKKITAKGGTMRLGAYPCAIKKAPLHTRFMGKQISANAIAIAGNLTMPILHNLKRLA